MAEPAKPSNEAASSAGSSADSAGPLEELTRGELELALRAAHLAISELRADLHALAAHVVALTEQTDLALRAGGGLAPPADEPEAFAARVAVRTEVLRRELEVSDERSAGRLVLAPPRDKYAVAVEDGPPCAELLPICGARCCTFQVALSSQDLDEGQLRWDYATPYALAKRGDGQCVHHTGEGCGVYAARPAVCRSYDCRRDERVWADYDQRILTPAPVRRPRTREGLERSALERSQATFVEAARLRGRR